MVAGSQETHDGQHPRQREVQMAEIQQKLTEITRRALAQANTPLHQAAAEGCSAVVRFLLENGGDPNSYTVWGGRLSVAPLHLAANREVAELLLTAGAQVNIRATGDPLTGYVNYTPLHYAVIGNRDRGVAEALLAAGADTEAREVLSGDTPLHLAVWSVEMIMLLLDHGANPNGRRNDGQTPLHLAYN